MKNKYFFCIIVFVIVLCQCAGSGVLAMGEQAAGEFNIQKLVEEKAMVVKPGVLPNSFWYWADIYSEQIGFLFTYGKGNKVDYLIGEAAERLAEMKNLSENGITNYMEDLLKRHDSEVKLASQLWQQLRDEGLIKAQKAQADLEKQILINQGDLEKFAATAPAEYDRGVDKAVSKVTSWLKNVVNHLAWKKGEINKQKAELSE